MAAPTSFNVKLAVKMQRMAIVFKNSSEFLYLSVNGCSAVVASSRQQERHRKAHRPPPQSESVFQLGEVEEVEEEEEGNEKRSLFIVSEIVD